MFRKFRSLRGALYFAVGVIGILLLLHMNNIAGIDLRPVRQGLWSVIDVLRGISYLHR